MSSSAGWSEPGVEEVADGVYRIPLPLPYDALRAVNVYALRTPDGLTMIDGGWALAASFEQLGASLARLGRTPSEIRRCLVTHIHRDHYTQAVALRREVGTRISLGVGEKVGLERIHRWIEDPRTFDNFEHLRRSGALDLLAQIGGRSVDTDPADWQLPDSWLADGERVGVGERELTVVPTPGHTRGHVVYHDEAAGLLFAGDHVLPHITPSIGFEPFRPDYPLRDYLDSLRLMLQRPDAVLLPAHGAAGGSVHARVTALIEHHAERLDASEAVVVAGASTALEAARALTWTRHKRSYDELDLLNQMLAVSETSAHLDVLVLQGRIASAPDEERIERYRTR